MRVMVIGKATKDTEAGVPPSQELLTAMGNYNEELVKAGIMLAGEGLKPSSQGKRVRFSGSKRTVIDGPFAETKELVAGYSHTRAGSTSCWVRITSSTWCRRAATKMDLTSRCPGYATTISTKMVTPYR
jgi:hypothetical protein